jgi:phage baseplate assembly protein W
MAPVPADLSSDVIEGKEVTEVGRILGRGIAFPPHIGEDGRVAWSEGQSNIREAIEIVLKTDRAERLRLPEFGGGVSRYLFEPNTAATQHQLADRIRKALDAWEPRIAVQSVELADDPVDAEAAVATVQYKLVATQSTERTSLSVQLAG